MSTRREELEERGYFRAECPVCGQDSRFMGILGARRYYRCPGCGTEHSAPIPGGPEDET